MRWKPKIESSNRGNAGKEPFDENLVSSNSLRIYGSMKFLLPENELLYINRVLRDMSDGTVVYSQRPIIEISYLFENKRVVVSGDDLEGLERLRGLIRSGRLIKFRGSNITKDFQIIVK